MNRTVLALAILASACSASSTVASPAEAPPPATPEAPPASTPAAPEPVVVAPVALAPSSDPIDRLVAYLNATHGLWVNGVMPNIPLPATATPDEVVARALRGYDGLQSSHVVVVRHVDIEGNDLRDTAALVDTNLGQRIVLMGYDPRMGWETKVFDTSH